MVRQCNAFRAQSRVAATPAMRKNESGLWTSGFAGLWRCHEQMKLAEKEAGH